MPTVCNQRRLQIGLRILSECGLHVVMGERLVVLGLGGQFVLVGNARVLSISPIYAHLIATLPHRVRPS